MIDGDLSKILVMTAAVLPAFGLQVFFVTRDSVKDARCVIWKTFFFGILILVPILFWESHLLGYGELFASYPLGLTVFKAFFGAAIPEECAKFLVLYLYCSRQPSFNHPTAILAFGIAASLGFACVENILYVTSAGAAWGAIAIIRAFFPIPMHAFCGIFMGFLLALSQLTPRLQSQFLILSLVIPISLHAVYDFLVFLPNHVESPSFLNLEGFAYVAITVFMIFNLVWARRLFRNIQNLRSMKLAS